MRDSFTENFKNDLAWLITLRAVKVRHSSSHFAIGVILPPPGAHLAPGWRQLTIAFYIVVVLSQFGFILFLCFLLC